MMHEDMVRGGRAISSLDLPSVRCTRLPVGTRIAAGFTIDEDSPLEEVGPLRPVGLPGVDPLFGK
jgi:hypothetical protein